MVQKVGRARSSIWALTKIIAHILAFSNSVASIFYDHQMATQFDDQIDSQELDLAPSEYELGSGHFAVAYQHGIYTASMDFANIHVEMHHVVEQRHYGPYELIMVLIVLTTVFATVLAVVFTCGAAVSMVLMMADLQAAHGGHPA